MSANELRGQDVAVERGERSRLRRPLLFGGLALLIIVAVIGGILWWLHARHYESTDDAFIDGHMVQVSPEIAGRIARVAVDDNEAVTAGQLLAEIAPADLQAKLDQAQANEAAALGSLAQAKAQQRAVAANVEEARSQVTVAEANATNAANELARDQQLVATKVVSRQQYGNAVASAKSAAANLQAAKKKEAAAEAQLGVAASQIETAISNGKSAAAQVEGATLNLSYTRILAPEAGHIAHKTVAVGDYVQTGETLMVLIPETLWVTANFKETQLDRIRPGQAVAITVDAYPDQSFHGHVDSIQRGSGAAFSLLPAENATGNYVKVVQRVPVKIVFDGPLDPRYALGPGMSVEPAVKVR